MRKIALCLCLGLLAGCSMAQSSLMENKSGLGCHSTSASYALSKTFVSVEIGGAVTSKGPNYYLKKVALERRADKGKRYCLDYLSSPTSDEAFTVQKNDRGLLERVVANSKDQSGAIAKKFASAVFTMLSQNPNFDPTLTAAGRSIGDDLPVELPTPFKAEFDPFNVAQTAVVNDSMRKFGFCILVEESGQTVSDPNRYCDRPMGGVSLEQTMADAYVAENERPDIKDTRAILYRPRVPYVMYLFAKDNLLVPGGWRLRASEAVHMENKSPVLGVGIDRAFFTQRKTILQFDEGVLRDIEIDKKSELAAFVEVPLFIAQGVAALPANIIQVRINNTNNNTLLINAQQQLIVAEREYRKTLKELTDLRAGTPGRSSGDAASAIQQRSSADTQSGNTQLAPPSAAAQAELTGRTMAQCVERNQTSWGPDEARRFCNCTLVECKASGIGDVQACATYCSRVRVN